MARQGWSGLVLGLSLALASCSSVDDGTPRISGYVMPTAPLPEEPVRITVSLLDVSKQDVAAEVLGQSSIALSAQWPVAYSLPYDPGQLESRYTLAIQARVTDGDGELIAITDSRHQFSENSDPGNFDLLVRNLADPGKQHEEVSVECGVGELRVTFFDQFMVMSNPDQHGRLVFLQVVAASGAKYQRESEIMWFKGYEAMYTDATGQNSCTVSAHES